MRCRRYRRRALAWVLASLARNVDAQDAGAGSEVPSDTQREHPLADEIPGDDRGEPSELPLIRVRAGSYRHDPSAHMFTHADDVAEHQRLHATLPRGPRRPRRNPNEPEVLELTGMPDAWYFHPNVGGRARVFVYLHARGADPREACMQFHPVVARFGWLVCPVGPGDRGQGHHVWYNNATLARRYALASLDALHRLYPRRVRTADDVIMGFSEGAFAAMQTGLAEPRVFPRWVIFAAHDGYIDMNSELYPAARRALHREYLITGEHDEIVNHTRRAAAFMTRNHLGRVQLLILPRAHHELPPDFSPVVRRALQWVTH